MTPNYLVQYGAGRFARLHIKRMTKVYYENQTLLQSRHEYDCVIQTTSQSAQVIAVTGEPVTPGLFAWTVYFESGGGLRQGQFYTALSGPRGRGRIQAQFYRTPIGATLGIWFKTSAEEIEVYNGRYPCP